MTESKQYSDEMLAGMQTTYGAGFLSPGGAEETRQMVDGLRVADAHILDLGCGVGGAAMLLVTELNARHVTGVDVEKKQITAARHNVIEQGLADTINIEQIEPGPLRFPGESFHFIITKDVICHIPDRVACFTDMLRLLKPGGVLVVADWQRGKSTTEGIFETWGAQLAASGLVFYFEPVEVYIDDMKQAGFPEVIPIDHTEWSRQSAAEQLAYATGANRQTAMANLGESAVERRNLMTETRLKGLANREIEHWHLRGIKD